MGDRGPTPLHSNERRRTNTPDHPIWKLGPDELAAMPFDIELAPAPPEVPTKSGDEQWKDEHPDAHWGRVVTELYEDLKRDPAVMWMTSGDWAWLKVMLEDLDREFKPQVVGISDTTYDSVMQEVVGGEAIFALVPVKASKMAAINQFMKSFGFGEANRLRMQKEVQLFTEFATTVKPESSEDIAASRLELLQGGQS